LGDGSEVDSVFETGKGILWISSGNRFCQTSAADVRSGKPFDLACESLTGTREINTPVELEDGSLWAGSETGGVWRYTGAKWEQHPGDAKFPTKNVLVDPAPSGGVWIYGDSLPVRATSRADLPEGLQILESISGWQGVPQVSTATMLEDKDGSLWMGTASGLVRVPMEVRSGLIYRTTVRSYAFLV
jgi:ligand-binding sensor domain-containing protein